MKKFLIRFTLFAFPFVLYLTGTSAIAYYTGESFSYAKVLQIQEADRSLIYNPYELDATFSYKVTYLQNYTPEVVILGSSRSLQYRSMFFNRNPDAVYNAGGHTWNLQEMLWMTRYFDAEALPDVIIMALEQPDFRAQDSFSYRPLPIDADESSPDRSVTGIANVTYAILGDRMSLSQILSPAENRIGLASVSLGYGFRFDGSFQIAPQILDDLDERRERHLVALENRSASYFSPATAISTHNLAQVETLLQWAHENDIYVIAYYPPFSESIYENMMASGDFSYMPESSSALTELFEQYDFPFFDFTNPAWLGSGDEGLYDGIHAGEGLYLQMHINMVRSLPDVLGEYADLETLEAWLASTDNLFDIPEDYP